MYIMSEITNNFEKYRDRINPEIVDFFAEFGDDFLDTYGTLDVLHNTSSDNVDSIVTDGLRTSAEPIDETDAEFALQFFQDQAGVDEGTKRQFDRYVMGTPQGRERGIFLYPREKYGNGYNDGYGIPERAHILAQEMSYVSRQDRFSDTDRSRAGEIAERLTQTLFGEHVSITVLRVDPFVPEVINNRLPTELVENFRDAGKEALSFGFEAFIRGPFEGIYIPQDIPAEAIAVEALLPLDKSRYIESIREFSRSRFYAPRPS